MGQEETVQFTIGNHPDESEERLWQHELFILDIMLTLYYLGPVPWSLSTTDRISTKTDKSKLPHGLQ